MVNDLEKKVNPTANLSPNRRSVAFEDDVRSEFSAVTNESEIRTNDEVGTFEIQSSKTSYVRLCSRFFGICFRRITTFFSFEIWLAKMSEYWVVHLSTKFNADLDEVLNYNN